MYDPAGVAEKRLIRERKVPIVWVGLEETPIQFANQFLIQREQDEYIFAIGALSPPKIMGTVEERSEQLQAVQFVQCRTLVRFGITEQRAREFAQLLTEFLEQYDRQKRGEET